MVINFASRPSIISQIIAELRDKNIQKDSFRKNMEHFGELIAFEISKMLDYKEKEITTSLGTATVPMLKKFPVLATILRASLPLHQGLLNIFDQSEMSLYPLTRTFERRTI